MRAARSADGRRTGLTGRQLCGGLRAAGPPPVTALSVYGSATQVVGAQTTTFLVVDAGWWRVVAPGCQSTATERPYQCEVSKG